MENSSFKFRDFSNESEYTGTNNSFLIPYIVADATVAFLAFFLNFMIIITFARDKSLRNRMSYFILSLALADFMVGTIAIPLGISIESGLIYGYYPCLFAVTTILSSFSVSKVSILAISYDRYCAVVNPLEYHQKKKNSSPKIIILICWATGFIVGYLPVFDWNDSTHHDGLCKFKNMKTTIYLYFGYMLVTIIPFIALVFMYGLIYSVIKNMNNDNDDSVASNSSIDEREFSSSKSVRRIKKREIKVTLNISIIVLVFVLCWAPLNILNFIDTHIGRFDGYKSLLRTLIVISHLNSAINPLLYSFQLKTFRNAVKINYR